MTEIMDEILSGKSAEDENFPVASMLLKKELRPHVMTYYKFARHADDVADNAKLSSEKKVEILNRMEKVLRGETEPDNSTQTAARMKQSLEETKVSILHASDLLVAFRRDSEGYLYETWEDLLDYCNYSAAPVGRFLLELHKEDKAAFKYSDSICAALQINNHIQDCKKDLLNLRRIYIPKKFLDEHGISSVNFNADNTDNAFRKVFDDMLDGVDELIKKGSPLPTMIKDKGLRKEVCIVIKLAKILARKLRKGDILNKKIELSKFDFLRGTITGYIRGCFVRYKFSR